MKIKNIKTGNICESDVTMVVEQWKKYPAIYIPVTDEEKAKVAKK